MKQFNWRKLKPDDGYFAALNIMGHESPISADLVFGLYVNGKMMSQKILKSRREPSARVIGSLKRDLIFWEGFAEYLNAGGRMVDISSELQALEAECNNTDRLVFEGWSYFDTGVSTEGNRVHEFISNDQQHYAPMRFVRWVRGEFIDTDLTELDMVGSDNDTTRSPAQAGSVGEGGTVQEG